MQVEVGSVVEGRVTNLLPFGAFISFGEGRMGLAHISEIADSYVTDVSEFLTVGQEVKAKVLGVEEKSGKISLSLKKASETGAAAQPKKYIKRPKKDEPTTPEEILERMLKDLRRVSEDKAHDLKKRRKNGNSAGKK